MAKPFKQFMFHFNSSPDRQIKTMSQEARYLSKYSMYIQSKDSRWLSKNIADKEEREEPIEEEIRD